MKTIELFSGTKSFSAVAHTFNYSTFTVDSDPKLQPDFTADIRKLRSNDFPCRPEMLWASPPCQGFSVAAIGRNWFHNNTPKTNTAREAVELVEHTLRLIEELQPAWWFIENPRGKLRKLPLLEGINRHTVAYCQYGDTRMKPTDIWTNADWWSPRPMCKNGAPCHESAPRGSKSGTQGIKGAQDRGRIPSAIFEEIFYHHRSRVKKAA